MLLAAAATASPSAPGVSQSRAPSYPWPQRTFEERVARYQECLARKPYFYHWEAREVLGQRGDPEALPILIEDYDRVREYAEYVHYTIAEVFGRNFGAGEFVAPLRTLRSSHRDPGDAWLWYQTLRTQTNAEGDAEAIQVATTDKLTTLRAAAILALGDSKSGDIKNAIAPNCVEFPKKESDRMVLLGAMTGTLFAMRARVNDAGYREALTAYIGLLEDEVGLSHTAKLQMARHLQIILKAPRAFLSPKAWLELLSRGEIEPSAPAKGTGSLRFFGIETDGDRLVYVIDMSDTMLKELPREAMPKVPVTGPKHKKKGAMLDESDIPWQLIKTRWDLVRENLRVSLSQLTPDQEFCVVWFGSEAGTLDACKGMIKASRGNINRAMAELDEVEARTQPNQENEVMPPGGKLRGAANLHGGLRLAFALHGRGSAGEFAYVDPKALTGGCDTILLLSDGAPSVDDFVMTDKNYGEGKVVGSFERGEDAPATPIVTYTGPYVLQASTGGAPLIADVRRMNAFRRVRLHAVGFGDANMRLLEQLAEIGQGESIVVGSKKAATGRGDGEKPGK